MKKEKEVIKYELLCILPLSREEGGLTGALIFLANLFLLLKTGLFSGEDSSISSLLSSSLFLFSSDSLFFWFSFYFFSSYSLFFLPTLLSWKWAGCPLSPRLDERKNFQNSKCPTEKGIGVLLESCKEIWEQLGLSMAWGVFKCIFGEEKTGVLLSSNRDIARTLSELGISSPVIRMNGNIRVLRN